jgi:protein-S-isoprenylcysteine O-methyltransferase Ste14
MFRLLALAYGLAAYVAFQVTVLLLVGLSGRLMEAPAAPDAVAAIGRALLIDLLLIAAFDVQHGMFARPCFRVWWTRVVPPQLERATFVLAAALTLGALSWQWRAIPIAVWTVDTPAMRDALAAAFWISWAAVVVASFLANHVELVGLHRMLFRAPEEAGAALRPPGSPALRHPIYIGFLVMFWSAPDMTLDRLVLAAGFTASVLADILRAEGGASIRALAEAWRKRRDPAPSADQVVPGVM